MVAAVTSLSKDKIRILLLEGIHASAVVNLARAGYQKVEQLKGALDRDTLLEKVSQAHMVGIRSRTQLDAEVLEAARRLMAIGCFCIGTNQVDLKAALNLGIPVFNAPFSNTRSVAELVLAEAILLLRGIPEKSLTAHEGGWLSPDALIVWEENAPQSAPPGFLLIDTRAFGDTHVTFLKAPR